MFHPSKIHRHTHAQPFYGPLSGTTRVSRCQKKKIIFFWTFMMQGKINRGRHTDHPAGRHSIRTNQRLTSVIPPFLHWIPSCRNPPTLSWLETGTKHARLHTQWHGSKRVTDVSWTITFPDRRFPDKTFPGQDISWTRRFPDKTFSRTITFPDKTFPGKTFPGQLRALTRRLFPIQDVSRTIIFPDRRFPYRRFPDNLYK